MSNEEQIRQALDGMATQASRKSASGIVSFLAKGFEIDGQNKSKIQNSLAYGMLTYAAIKMDIDSSQIEVKGDTATSKGRYKLGLKREFNAPEEQFEADFNLKWKRENGQWKISNANGNKLPPGIMGGF